MNSLRKQTDLICFYYYLLLLSDKYKKKKQCDDAGQFLTEYFKRIISLSTTPGSSGDFRLDFQNKEERVNL